MEFTYASYKALVNWISNKGYTFSNFNEFNSIQKSVVMRHDIDLSVEKALEMALIDHSLGVKSTFFFLITSNFYNLMTSENKIKLKKIIELKHTIGLHFDELQYNINSVEEFEKYLAYEISILEKFLDLKINVFSNHRPSEFVLNGLQLNNRDIINAYSTENFKVAKYFSDSRMNWREDIYSQISKNDYSRIQINIHPFWYSNDKENIREKFINFIRIQKANLFKDLELGTKDFSEIISQVDQKVEIDGFI